MLTVNEVTEIFYLSDEFSKEFDVAYKNHLLKENNGKKHRNKPNRLSNSEVMTILMSFHLSGMRNLKHYYLFYVCKHLKEEFPHLVSYSRFVELQQKVALPLVMFLKTCRMGSCTGSVSLILLHWKSVISSVSIRTAYLMVLQPKEKALWAGFLDSSCILSSMTRERSSVSSSRRVI